MQTLRWLAAAALTLLAHAAAVWAVVGWRSATVAPSDPPPAVMIDLSSVAPSSRAPERNAADGPQMTEATPSPSDRVAERTMQAAAPNPSPLVPDAPAEARAPERPVAVKNPAARPEPPPAETKADSKPQPAQPLKTQAPPALQPPSLAVEDSSVPLGVASEAEPPPSAAPQQEATPTASPSSPELAKPPDAPREEPPRASLIAEPPSLLQKLPRRRQQSRSPYLRQRHRPPILRVGRRRRRISAWSERNPPKSTIGRRQITLGLRQDRPRQRRGPPRRPIQAAARAWPRPLRPGRASLSRTSIASSASRRMPRRAGLHPSLLRLIAAERGCRRA
jgi:protein TonB